MHVQKFVINYKQMFHFWWLMQFDFCFEIPFTYHIPERHLLVFVSFSVFLHRRGATCVWTQRFYWCVVIVVSQKQRTYKSSFERMNKEATATTNTAAAAASSNISDWLLTNTHHLYSSEREQERESAGESETSVGCDDSLWCGVCSFNL